MDSTFTSAPALPEFLEVTTPQTRAYRLRFTGSAGEYFRIWIVNVFLTLITLGIYAAWAKVRTRRYFYAHTLLDGHPFEYHGNPRAILKGNLIVGLGVIVYYAVQQIRPEISLALFAVGYCVFPWLVFQSLRFMGSNSSYRNIRFRFHGTLGMSYINYFLLPICSPFTLGLLGRTQRSSNAITFLGTPLTARHARVSVAAPERFNVYLAAYGVFIGLSIAVGVVLGMTFFPMFSRGRFDPSLVYWVLIPVYGSLLLVFTLMQQYIYARLANYTWANTHVPGMKFVSVLSATELIKIRFTNLIAIFLSLGLLSPWAKVRFTQYVLGGLSIVATTDLESFAADVDAEANALGDAATDLEHRLAL